MAFSDFTLSDLQTKFGIKNQIVDLFDDASIQALGLSEILIQQLEEAAELPIKSEKARSELIVTPILMELRRKNDKFFTIYSGDTLIADREKGLTGECDFLLAKETGSFSINVPILTIVEAKKQDMEAGINQCAAQLYGAKIFNENTGMMLPKIYGCVTTADSWKFMLIENNLIKIDNTTYYKSEIGKILSLFQEIIDYYRDILVEQTNPQLN
ncbi:MAG: hypothetical protein AAGI49_18750 [Bacteroidota bacterium]